MMTYRENKLEIGALHSKIRNKYGSAKCCKNPTCEGKSKVYHWALKKGREYSDNPNDYTWLCAKCHKSYDAIPGYSPWNKRSDKEICNFKDCEDSVASIGMCKRHYSAHIYLRHKEKKLAGMRAYSKRRKRKCQSKNPEACKFHHQ